MEVCFRQVSEAWLSMSQNATAQGCQNEPLARSAVFLTSFAPEATPAYQDTVMSTMAAHTVGTILLISPFCRIHVFCGVFFALNQDVWEFRSNVLTERVSQLISMPGNEAI